MTLKDVFAEYGYPIVIIVLLLAILPPVLVPYLGVFGVYASYVTTALVAGLSIWLVKRTKKYVEPA